MDVWVPGYKGSVGSTETSFTSAWDRGEKSVGSPKGIRLFMVSFVKVEKWRVSDSLVVKCLRTWGVFTIVLENRRTYWGHLPECDHTSDHDRILSTQ